MDGSINNINAGTIVKTSGSATIRKSDTMALRTRYHLSEIDQNKRIISTAIGIIIAGFVIICVGVVVSFFGKISSALITCISGVIVDAIAGTIFWMVGKSTESKLNYFSKLSNDEEREKLIELIYNERSDRFREKMIEKLIDRYCKQMNKEVKESA